MLNDGVVAEKGNHSELLEQKGIYYHMVRLYAVINVLYSNGIYRFYHRMEGPRVKLFLFLCMIGQDYRRYVGPILHIVVLANLKGWEPILQVTVQST